MLKLRIITALILIPLVIWGIFVLPQNYFALVDTTIIALAAWEWAGLIGWSKRRLRALYIFITLMTLLLGRFASYLLQAEFSIYLSSIFWLAVFGYLLFIRNKPSFIALPNWLVGISGLLILAGCWEALLILHAEPKLLLFMLILIWLTDTFAYFGGRLWGKHKLAATISPNKTWEGLVSGVGVTFIVGIIGLYYFITPQQFTFGGPIIILITILISVVGDLFESLLKRQVGIKDSGQLLPGHGGVLDRLDSLFAAAPLFASGILLATNLLS